MKHNKKVTDALNVILKNELTAINQYFLHARMLKHMGFMKLADIEYKESIDEMRHADQLVERILFLGGLPNLQDLGKLSIGETVKEILECDLKIEEAAHADLSSSITIAEEEGDRVSADMLLEIQASEEEHSDFISKQLRIIDKIGEQAYMQTLV